MRGSGSVLAVAAIAAWLGSAVAEPAAGPRLALTLLDRGVVEFHALDGTKLGEAKTGPGPRALALHDGELVIANRGVGSTPGSTLTFVDPEAMAPLRTVRICDGCAPRSLVFDRKGRLWLTGQAHRSLYRLDPPYRDPTGSVLLAWGWPTDLVRMEGAELLVIGYRDAEGVAVVETEQQFFTRVRLFEFPEHVAARPGRPEVWIASTRHAGLARLRPGAERGRFETEQFPLEVPASGLAITPDGGRLVVGLIGKNALALVDPETGEITARLDLGGDPGRLTVSPADPPRAAVWMPVSKEIVLVDLARRDAPKIERRFAVDGAVGGLAFLP